VEGSTLPEAFDPSDPGWLANQKQAVGSSERELEQDYMPSPSEYDAQATQRDILERNAARDLLGADVDGIRYDGEPEDDGPAPTVEEDDGETG
jgi:hypothetical protein